jgi:hypothetical protein
MRKWHTFFLRDAVNKRFTNCQNIKSFHGTSIE